MTKTQAIDYARTVDRLCDMGFTRAEAEALFRIERTLRRWFERECGDDRGAIERDEKTDKPFYVWWSTDGREHRYAVPDREAGARKRLARIMAEHPTCTAYVQTDPRGCALYIIPLEALADGAKVDSVYNARGEAVCY